MCAENSITAISSSGIVFIGLHIQALTSCMKIVKKLIVAIKKLLKVTTLHNRNISFSETPSTPEEITKELNKRNVNFQFEIADIYWVFMESLYFIMYEVIGKDFGKKYIFNEIDDIEVTNLANKILEYFCDIPREYETQISLPQLILPNTPNDCELYLLSEVKKDLKKAMQFPPPLLQKSALLLPDITYRSKMLFL
jgi:hypothetical protein